MNVMDLMFVKMDEYEAALGEEFPSFSFMGKSPSDTISIIEKCISEHQNVYELGFLHEDDVW